MTAPLIPVFDGHNDTVLKLVQAARAGQPIDLAAGSPRVDIDLPRARAGGFAGGFFAMFSPSDPWRLRPFDPDDPEATRPLDQPTALGFTMALFAGLRRLCRAPGAPFVEVATAAEARAAMAAGRIAVLPHIEGAECIDRDLDALEVLHAAGLRSLGLVWSRPNAFGHGAPMAPAPAGTPDQGAAGEGLTGAGRALVRACEALGVIVDLSHLNEAGFWDVARIATRPLVATHSNAHALSPSARNLTDRQLDAIAESGGVVGLNFHLGYLTPDCAIRRDIGLEVPMRHLDHLLARLGERGVALGSDFDGCDLPDALPDVAGLPRLVAAMRAAGYGEALIARICHGNWLDLIARWQGAQAA